MFGSWLGTSEKSSVIPQSSRGQRLPSDHSTIKYVNNPNAQSRKKMSDLFDVPGKKSSDSPLINLTRRKLEHWLNITKELYICRGNLQTTPTRCVLVITKFHC